jgi:Flp pilus assembly protein TadD
MRAHGRSRPAAALALLVAMQGCAAWSGARLYASGTHALDRGDAPQAVADLEEAARLLPESSEVQNHLGIAYEATGREDAALSAWRRAVALDCGNEAAARNLRQAEGRSGSAPPVSRGKVSP